MTGFPQLPRVSHNVRHGSTGGQPPRWGVAYNPNGTGPGEMFHNGVLLGWQGWVPYPPEPYWRYWDGTTFGNRFTLLQRNFVWDHFDWQIFWYVLVDGDLEILGNSVSPDFSVEPWGPVVFAPAWFPISPFADPAWMPPGGGIEFYRTSQDALDDWPDALTQADYWETWGM